MAPKKKSASEKAKQIKTPMFIDVTGNESLADPYENSASGQPTFENPDANISPRNASLLAGGALLGLGEGTGALPLVSNAGKVVSPFLDPMFQSAGQGLKTTLSNVTNPSLSAPLFTAGDLVRKGFQGKLSPNEGEDKFKYTNRLGSEVGKSATGESLTSNPGGKYDIGRYASEAVGGGLSGLGAGARSAGKYVKESIANPLFSGLEEAVFPGSKAEDNMKQRFDTSDEQKTFEANQKENLKQSLIPKIEEAQKKLEEASKSGSFEAFNAARNELQGLQDLYNTPKILSPTDSELNNGTINLKDKQASTTSAGNNNSAELKPELASILGKIENGIRKSVGQTAFGPVLNNFGLNQGNNSTWDQYQSHAAGVPNIDVNTGKLYTDSNLISALAEKAKAGPKALSYEEMLKQQQQMKDPWNFMPDSTIKNELQKKQAVRVQMADMANQQKGYVDQMSDAVARGQEAIKSKNEEAKALAQKDFDRATNNLRSMQGQYSAFISMAAGQGAMSEGDKDNLDRANSEVKAQLNSSAGAGGFQSSDGGTQFLRIRQNLDNSLQSQWNFLKSTEAPFRMVADNFGLDDRTFRVISGNDTIDKSYQKIAPYILTDRTGRETVLDAKSIGNMDQMVLAANDLQLQDLLKGAERTGTLEAYVMNASPSALARLKKLGINLSGISTKIEKQKGVFQKNPTSGSGNAEENPNAATSGDL